MLNFLGDHRIENEIVFPAAAYIEMALQSAKETGLNNSHVLSDFVFKERLIFQEGKPTSVQALLSPLQEDSFLFSVYSRTVPEENWKLYASATFIKNQAAGDLVALFRTSPEVIRQESTSEFTAEEFYQTAQSRGLQYGPGFRVLQHVWSKDDESVGHISLPEVIQNEISIYQIHPALLDGCLQVLAAMVRGSFEHDLYLPTGCRSIRMLSQPERDLWSHVSISPASAADGDFLTADIRLFDSNNQTVGELIGFRLQRTSRHIRHLLSRQNSWLYQLQWQASPEPGNSPVTFRGGKHWLIFADDEGLGEELAMQLEAGGDHCYLIRCIETIKKLEDTNEDAFLEIIENHLKEIQSPLHGIIHLWSLSIAPPSVEVLATAGIDQLSGCNSVLYLVQALSRRLAGMPRLWLVTRGAQSVKWGEAIAVEQSALWGLGKVISFEMPELKCIRVDIDPSHANWSCCSTTYQTDFNG